MATWEPEVVVDEQLARRLLAQFPELDGEDLQLLAYGWDYTVWAVGGRYAFRFPRRQIGIPGTEREIASLPSLAPLLPLPVPNPLFVGHATEEYPWPFFGSALLAGREIADAGLDDDGRVEVALQLAGFLRVLHALDVDLELPVDVNRRADMSYRVPLARDTLAQLEGLDASSQPPALAELLDRAELLPVGEPTAVVHGDLHFRQVLVEKRRVTGVIDWVDICRSDPAIDLSLVWSFLPADRRAAFLDAYGPVTDEQLERARVVAISLCAALACNARAEGLVGVEREALDGLERALDDRIRL
jgi:aminoglycoside phosphotransferase (APT) family kinase protein